MAWAIWLAAALDPLGGPATHGLDQELLPGLGVRLNAAARGLGVSPSQLELRAAAAQPLIARLRAEHPEVLLRLTDLMDRFKKSGGVHTMGDVLGAVHGALSSGQLKPLVHMLHADSAAFAEVRAASERTQAELASFEQVMEANECTQNNDCARIPGNLMGAQCVTDPSKEDRKVCGCMVQEDCEARVNRDSFVRACSDYLGLGFTTCGPAVENPAQATDPPPPGDAPVEPPKPRNPSAVAAYGAASKRRQDNNKAAGRGISTPGAPRDGDVSKSGAPRDTGDADDADDADAAAAAAGAGSASDAVEDEWTTASTTTDDADSQLRVDDGPDSSGRAISTRRSGPKR